MSTEAFCGTLIHNTWIKNIKSAYTPAQAVEWLEVMGLENLTSVQVLTDGAFRTTLDHLTLLVKHFVLTFPFENTAMHYSPDHYMNIAPQALFRRMVLERRGGSYCFGLNSLLIEMLRALGFRAYSTTARVNESSAPGVRSRTYTSPVHQIIFVQPEEGEITYVVDVGFGTPGLMRPILLSCAEDNTVMGVDRTEMHRLTRSAYPSSSLQPSKTSTAPVEIKWNLEVRHTKEKAHDSSQDWRILYTFSEEEYFFRDFQDASFMVLNKPDPKGYFWTNVLCVKTFVLEDGHAAAAAGGGVSERGDEILYRKVLFGREVKRHIGSVTTVIRTLASEEERILALKEEFGVLVDPSWAANILGRLPAL